MDARSIQRSSATISQSLTGIGLAARSPAAALRVLDELEFLSTFLIFSLSISTTFTSFSNKPGEGNYLFINFCI